MVESMKRRPSAELVVEFGRGSLRKQKSANKKARRPPGKRQRIPCSDLCSGARTAALPVSGHSLRSTSLCRVLSPSSADLARCVSDKRKSGVSSRILQEFAYCLRRRKAESNAVLLVVLYSCSDIEVAFWTRSAVSTVLQSARAAR